MIELFKKDPKNPEQKPPKKITAQSLGLIQAFVLLATIYTVGTMIGNGVAITQYSTGNTISYHLWVPQWVNHTDTEKYEAITYGSAHYQDTKGTITVNLNKYFTQDGLDPNSKVAKQLRAGGSAVANGSNTSAYVITLLTFIGNVFLLFGFILIYRVLQSTKEGDPFVSRNVKRLRLLAIGYLIIPTVIMIAIMTIATTVLTNAGISWSFDLPLDGLGYAVFFFALSAIFQRGSELRENEELTV